MDRQERPSVPIQYHALVHSEIGDKCLDFYALARASNTATEPGTFLAKRRLMSRLVSNSALLSDPGESFVIVRPSDYSERAYRMREEEDDAQGNPIYATFDDNNVKMEFTHRHPGTSMDTDVEAGVDPAEKYPHYKLNEDNSPITTTAADHLYCVAFSGPDGVASELKASFDLQLSARIDEARQCLAFDCFEFKPRCFDPTSVESLPTYRELKRWDDCVMRMPKSHDDEDSDTDEDDPDYDEKVRPKEGQAFGEETRMVLTYQKLVGNFLDSRCMRLWVPLDNVIGVRLQAAPVQRGSEGNDDVGAVLILQVKCPPKADAFAARKVLAKYSKENTFALVDDWTPNQVASGSTRYYLYGNLTELKQTAALMTKLCPHIATMLGSETSVANLLRVETSVDYATAPNFAEPADVDMRDANDTATADNGSNYVMSVDNVHRILFEKNLVGSTGEAHNVNPCLKRAILLGHIKVEDSTTTDTVIYCGSCVHCGNSLCCTFGNAMFQTTYGGHDYCDGGDDAGVKCESCTDEDDFGGGNYITGLCRGEFDFDSGRIHNHCTECKDFGTCLNDYREAHCEHCGDHYFAGNSGFPCPSCGGGKSKPLKNMDPPPLTAWDGEPENAMEVFDAQCAGLGVMERSMLRTMVLGPEAAFAGGNVSDSSQVFSAMIRQMAGQIMDTDNEGGSGNESVPEECRQM